MICYKHPLFTKIKIVDGLIKKKRNAGYNINKNYIKAAKFSNKPSYYN